MTIAEHPERIARLVLTPSDAFDNFLPPMFRYLQWSARIPGATFLLVQSMRQRFVRRMPNAYGWLAKHPIPDELSDAFVAPVVSDPGVRRDVTKILRAISPSYTLRAASRLGEFAGPVLIAWASEDRFFPVSHAHELAQRFANARVVLIDDSYTFVPLDQPMRLVELIADFASVGTVPSRADTSARGKA
jgi:pimeloyl-ACP methyl ester carboxylesterase